MTHETYSKQEFNAKLHSSIESVLTGMRGNAATDTAMRARLASAISGGYDFADTLHSIYADYGYPLQVEFSHFWNMYRRFGVARRCVELYPDHTWLDVPVIEGPAAFVAGVDKLVKQRALWRRLRGLDVRQRVGRYAGMFMRVRDSKMPNEPLEGSLGAVEALVEMVPLYESQLRVSTTQDDPVADDYGQPTMYQYIGSAAGNRNEKAAASFDIHPSRIVIAAEGADNGGIYGVPALESIYNSLMDLRKIIGAGGEGFYKNASQNVVFNLQDPSSARTNKDLLDAFNENYDDFAQNRMRRAMWTPGLDAKTLESHLVNPKEFAANTLMDIAAGANAPLALLVGNQEGRLAGDQDTKGFLSQVQARRNDFGTEMVTALLDWCVKWGLLPSAEYEIEWPDATAPSDDEKLANADKMADINQKLYMSGEAPAFTQEEVREQAGYENVGEELPERDDVEGEGEEGEPSAAE